MRSRGPFGRNFVERTLVFAMLLECGTTSAYYIAALFDITRSHLEMNPGLVALAKKLDAITRRGSGNASAPGDSAGRSF